MSSRWHPAARFLMPGSKSARRCQLVRTVVAAAFALTPAVGASAGARATAAAAAAPDAEKSVQMCFGCHGPKGVSSIGGIPSLAGQNSAYLMIQLQAIGNGARPSETMAGIVAALPPGELPVVINYFAEQPYIRNPQTVDAARVARGRESYLRNCQICHPSDGRDSSYEDFPLLAGQDLDYMKKTVGEIVSGRRPVSREMRELIETTPMSAIEDALHFFAAQTSALP